MRKLLSFAPFFAFLAIERVLGIGPGLYAGAAVAWLALLAGCVAGRGVRLLEAGGAVLFSALASYAALAPQAHLSVGLVRLYVDTGMLLLVLAGLALGRPFVMDYGPAPLEKANKVAAVWAAAFAVLALADLLLVLRPGWPLAVPLVMSAAALGAAGHYTLQALGRRRQRAGGV